VGNKDKTDTEKRLEIKDQRPDTEREREREREERAGSMESPSPCLST